MTRSIIHADLDAFYASVEQRDDPTLRGRPVVVGGAPEHRGVVAAASYEARAFGIRSAMAMSRAYRLCPGVIRQSPRFPVYAEVSATVMECYRRLTPLVEPIALDEAYLDLTETCTDQDSQREMAAQLKLQVRDAVGLTVSIGAGISKSVAKIASDLEKPNGLVIVPSGDERDFLAPLPVGHLWGVGPRAEERLLQLGVRTIGELAAIDARLLTNIFGRWGTMLHSLANGDDDRPVESSRETKSIARETTFAHDIEAFSTLRDTLERLCDGVAERLQRRGLHGRTVTLKLRRADFSTLSRQTTLPMPTQEAKTIQQTAESLLRREVEPGSRFRLIGVAVSGFDTVQQLPLPLFDDEANPSPALDPWGSIERDH